MSIAPVLGAEPREEEDLETLGEIQEYLQLRVGLNGGHLDRLQPTLHEPFGSKPVKREPNWLRFRRVALKCSQVRGCQRGSTRHL